MRTAAPARTIVVAAVLALTLGACGGPSAEDGGGERMSIGASAVPAALDPRTSSPFDALWVGMLYDALLSQGPDGTVGPGLAESWSFSGDGRTLEFALRPGVTFQDGAPLDAAAVKANIDASRTGGTNFSDQLKDVEGVEVVDPLRVRVGLAGSPAPMLGVFAGEAGMMISPQALRTDDLSTEPAGTGAFTLDRFAGRDIEFTAWDGYWNAAAVSLGGVDVTVFLDESARVRALRSGQVDAAFVTPQQIPEVEADGLRVTATPATESLFYGVLLNTGRAALGDPRVRQAMMLGLDRASISRTVFGENSCLPSAQPFAPDDWAFAPGLDARPAAQYDPERASALLAEAGQAGGFEVELQSNTIQSSVQLTQILQAQWGAIGIRVKLRPMENVQFVTARRQGEFDATVSTYLTSRPDQSTFVKNFYLPGGLFNPSGYQRPGVAEMLAQASAHTDPAARQAPMHQLITGVLEAGPPVVPICNRSLTYAVRQNVQDLDLSLGSNVKYATLRRR